MEFVAVCGRKVCVGVCVKAEGRTKKKKKGCKDGRIGQAQTEKAREYNKKREGQAKTEKRQEQSKDEEASMEY